MREGYEKKELKKRSENLSDWYRDVILKAELADYGPCKGTMVIRPYGYAIWERVREIFDSWIKEYGVENAYFPLLIPMSLLEKEEKHVAGFSPELAVVTHGGGKKLSEPLVVRPTSETVMYHMYSKWISSHRDLPMMINQWNNIVRWELRTYLFLRTTEFLWQEGHTSHATKKEAVEMQETALAWYRKIYEEYFAMPVVVGEKSVAERFAGAEATFSVEALMPDGKALQAATSHNLGQNFSKAFDISFQDKNSKNKFVWQTSWGLSTRSLGGLFLVHGDDHGVLVPPKLAPVQVVIVPVRVEKPLVAYARQVEGVLGKVGVRVRVDVREGQSMGRKINDWEVKGVPLRMEIGDKEKSAESVTLVRRDNGEKVGAGLAEVGDVVGQMLDEIQKDMFDRAKRFLEENTHEVKNYEEFRDVMAKKRGFVKVWWKEDGKVEARIKEETKATPRVRLLDSEGKGKCFVTGKETSELWYFAQAY